MRDLFPWPAIKPRPPVLGAWSFCHWTTGEVPVCVFLFLSNNLVFLEFTVIAHGTLKSENVSCSVLFNSL